MKISKYVLGIFVINTLIVIAVGAADSPKMMSVQVKTTALRDAPSFIGKPVATLAYGDRVEVIGVQGPWTRVSAAGGLTGWAHTSALSPKRIVLKAGQETAQTRASGDELALAGKGFNSDVEGEFRRQHRNIDFTWIDRMEKIRISQGEMQVFLKEGDVTPREGGAQ